MKEMKSILFLLVLVSFMAPLNVWAIEFCPVQGLSGVKVPCTFESEGPAGAAKANVLIATILNVGLALVGSVAVIFLMYGAYRYITAYGNEEHAETAKRVIRESILGIIIVILAFAIINVVTNVLIGGRTGAF